MWHHGDVELLLNSRCNGNSTGAAAQPQSLKLSGGQFAVNIFRMMSSDVNKHRLEAFQLINSAEQALSA